MSFVKPESTPLATLGLLLALLACVSPAASERARQERLASEANALAGELARGGDPAPGGLSVRLAFGADADLDLYVTDPAQETVYFANSPTRAGGRLDADLRCAAAAPRVESVSFAAPAPGRYRVGVDFPERCDGTTEPVSFVVEVWTGGEREQRRGSVRPGAFLPIVLEFDAPARR